MTQQRISIGSVRPFDGRPGSYKLEWTIWYGGEKKNKTASSADLLVLDAFRTQLLQAAEAGAVFDARGNGCPPGVERPSRRATVVTADDDANTAARGTAGLRTDVQVKMRGDAQRRPLLVDVAERLHKQWRSTPGNTLRAQVDVLVTVGEALLPDTFQLTATQQQGLRAYLRHMLTPAKQHLLLAQAQAARDAASAARFEAKPRTSSQRSQRQRNDDRRRVRRQVAEANRQHWEAFYREHGLTWQELDLAAIRAVEARLGRKARREGVAEAAAASNTVARRTMAWAELLKHAVKVELLPVNPRELLDEGERNSTTIRPRPVDARLIVDVSTLKALVEAAQRLQLDMVGDVSRFAAFLAVLCFAAARPPAEILGMVRSSLHEIEAEEWSRIFLPASLPDPGLRFQADAAGPQPAPLKHREVGETRAAEISTFGAAWLLRLKKALPETMGQDDPLFADADGRELSRASIYAMWQQVKDAVFTTPETEVLRQKLDLYDLRHARASHLMAAPVRIPEIRIAQSLGHSVAILLSTYTGVVNQSSSKWANQVDEHYEDLVPPDLLPPDRREREGLRPGGPRPRRTRALELLAELQDMTPEQRQALLTLLDIA